MSSVDMPPPSPSWRHLSSTRISSIKEYFHQSAPSTSIASSHTRVGNAIGTTDDRRQSWRAWAAQKIRSRMRSPQRNPTNEILTLFPGWAARRYAVDQTQAGACGEPIPFEVEAFVSGYAISHRSREQTSRSQRAFIRLAKGFASLPRIIDNPSPTDNLSPNEPFDRIDSPQASDEFRMQELERKLQSLDSDNSEPESDSESSSRPDSISGLPLPIPPPNNLHTPADVLQKLHYNLESRLQMFWSSTLPARTVRIHLFASPNNFSTDSTTNDADEFEHGPLASQDVTTAVDGSFSARFRINWQDLCLHPNGLHIAFGETPEEHNLVIVAELLPLPPPTTCSSDNSTSVSTSSSSPSSSTPPTSSYHSHPHNSLSGTSGDSHPHSRSHRHPHLHSVLTSIPTLHNLPSLATHSSLSRFFTLKSTVVTRATIPLTHSSIRVISDIDDTIKRSGVTEGARAVFHNVFVKELKDGIIPGMGDWYTDMWNKGLRFHYVSNGPFEYLSLLHEFFHLSKIPPGSIKLKSYAGRSLLSGLLSTPAGRKRAGVIDILDSFPDSNFILIGDSGEQDLELYAELARERPTQILAVFIRDTDETSDMRLDDPTGWGALSTGTQQPDIDGLPNILTDTLSTPALTSRGNEQSTPRPGKARRMFSDTFTYPRSGKDTNRPLHEVPDLIENNSAVTPTQQQFSTFFDSSLPPPSPLSSSPASVSSFSSAPRPPPPSAPTTPNPNPTYITTQPRPVPSLMIPTSSSISSAINSSGDLKRSATDYSLSVPQSHHRQSHDPSKSKLSLTKRQPSPIECSPSSPSYYKPADSSSRSSYLASFTTSRARNSGSVLTPGGIGPTYTGEGGSSGSSGSSGSWTGGGAIGWSGSGKLSSEHKKRQDLQTRVYRARTQMPSKVKLRVFRDPSECFADVGDLLAGD